MFFAVFPAQGQAYETDPLTARAGRSEDATAVADALMDGLVALAIARANDRTACRGSDAEVRTVFAEELHRATARDAWVMSRGLLRAPGFSTFSAALERSTAPRQGYPRRSDLFGSLTVWQSVVLTVAGPCSRFQVGHVEVGSDKFDHFLDMGFDYWVSSDFGADTRHAVARGTRTERSIYGLLTSKTFSWSDLKANWDGYRFYLDLLDEESVFSRSVQGCIVQTRPWSWTEWVDPLWDEALNPPVFTRLVERAVLKRLDDDRSTVCADMKLWDPSGDRPRRMRTLAYEPPWVEGPTPDRRDSYQLDALCDPQRTKALVPHEVGPRQEIRAARRAEADRAGSRSEPG